LKNDEGEEMEIKGKLRRDFRDYLREAGGEAGVRLGVSPNDQFRAPFKVAGHSREVCT